MKKRTRLIACMMAGILSLTALSGCGEKGAGDGKEGSLKASTLKIVIAKLGYGDQWLLDLAEAYQEKTGTEVEVLSKVGEAGIASINTETSSMASDADLFFTKLSNDFFKQIYKGSVTAKGELYDCAYADLTEVWESKADGADGKTIAEKMQPGFAEYFNVDGKYYGIPWAQSILGIVRNKNVWDRLSLSEEDVPRTTDELFALCDKVKAKGVAPFIYSLSEEYYTAFAPIWFAQYEGSESFGYFCDGLDPVGEASPNLYAFDGQRKALEVLETLVSEKNGYQHESSISASFTDMQSSFLLDQALFCVNGDWLEIEMGANFQGSDIDYIKTPVISSIIEKLDSVNDDATLSAVIKYVDGDSNSAPAGVSEDDIATVRDARQFAYEKGGYNHVAFVPAYSEHLETAKDFLKFMYSDEGLNIFYRSTAGQKLPAECTAGYDDSVEATPFRKSINEVLATGMFCDSGKVVKNKLFCLGGVDETWGCSGGANLVRRLLNGDTPEQICIENNNYLKKNWSNITSYQ